MSKRSIATGAVSVSSGNAREKVKEVRNRFPFDGLFCGTDTIAIGAMRGIQDTGRMGKLAADSIVRMIAGDRSGETIILRVEFLARGSTR